MKALRLQNNDFVQVAGPDSKTFLQGQVSCNMDRLSPTQSLMGVLCNLKGRVIADFRAIEVAGNVWLQTETGMGQRLIDVLAKYAVFSKVEISLLDSVGPTVGVLIDQESDALSNLLGPLPAEENLASVGDNFALVRLPSGLQSSENRYQIFCLDRATDSITAKLMEIAETASESEWQRAEMQAGIIHVQAEDSEEFTPQLLNYDLSGVIDFKKGCYTGQEIVARMFYRSTAKKRLYLLSCSTPINPDDELIYWEKGKENRANILRFANSGDSKAPALILAVIGTEADSADTPPQLSAGKEETHSNNLDSSLKFLTLPYTE